MAATVIMATSGRIIPIFHLTSFSTPSRYIGLSMTDGVINLHTLDSITEYYEQGDREHICVGTAKYLLKADTLVFTATMNGKTIATVEISLKDFSILQCRAFANGICKYTEQIDNIINANKKMIAERTESRRVSA